MNWERNAACADTPSEVMHPENVRGNAHHRAYALATQFCASCPVTERCLLEALRTERAENTSHRTGMRGGLLPNQRYELHLTQKRIKQIRAQMHQARTDFAGPWLNTELDRLATQLRTELHRWAALWPAAPIDFPNQLETAA